MLDSQLTCVKRPAAGSCFSHPDGGFIFEVMLAAGLTSLKSFRFSSLGRAARVGDDAGPARQPDDTADEQHGLQAHAAARTTSGAGEDSAAPEGASPDNDVDSDAGRKRKAEEQGVLSPAQAGSQPAAATAVLVKRRASPTLPMATPLGGRSAQGAAANVLRGAVPGRGVEHRPEASAAPAVQRPSGTSTASAANTAQQASSIAISSKHSAMDVPSREAESREDDEDEDDTVLPGNSRLAARVMAGRQSLAPSRARVGQCPCGALVARALIHELLLPNAALRLLAA